MTAVGLKPLTYPTGGLRRLPFMLVILGLMVGHYYLLSRLRLVERYHELLPELAVPYCLLYLIPVLFRLRNIGMKPYWVLAALVPLLNLWIFARCVVFPEGFMVSRQQDRSAHVLTVLFLILIIAAIIAMVVYSY